MLALAVWFETIDKPGHATWLLIYGLASVLFGASQVTDDLISGAVLYLVLGLGSIVFGWAIKRGIPVAIGGISSTCAFGTLSYDYFDNSIVFSLVVFAVGICILLGATYLGGGKPSRGVTS